MGRDTKKVHRAIPFLFLLLPTSIKGTSEPGARCPVPGSPFTNNSQGNQYLLNFVSRYPGPKSACLFIVIPPFKIDCMTFGANSMAE
ncbi:hypothetical protein F4778DRAFT_755349 [Xylariomycetidae sp. FL2044]|nr:hypothetical protein F4778DRAFT_755349 [Xylariomycetidae sp. FL2044]